MSLFFVLSGFVLTWTHRPGEPAREFYRRRVARILPAYWTAFLVAFALVGSTNAIYAFGLIQAWSPEQSVYYAVNAPFWSLSAEAFFYACFPLLLPSIWRLTKREVILVATLSGMLAIAIPVALHSGVAGIDGVFLIYIFPPVRLLEFLLGACLCRLLQLGLRLRVPVVFALATATAAYVAAGFVPSYMMWVAVTLVPFALLIFACAEADLDGRWTGLRHRSLIRLGEWSFAFYLLHMIVLVRLFTYVERAGWRSSGVGAVLLYALSVAAAFLLYRTVERPLERRIRGRGPAGRRSGSAVVLTAARSK